MPTIRAFIAVRIAPDRRIERLLARLDQLGRSTRCIDAANLHLTLRFLGDVDADLIDPIAAALGRACAAARPFRLALRALGAFPHLDRPRVIWVGVHDAEPIHALCARLDEQLDALDVPPRDRPWTPHLTLARLHTRPPRALRDLFDEQGEIDLGPRDVHAVHLVRSTLTPRGPVYDDLITVNLIS